MKVIKIAVSYFTPLLVFFLALCCGCTNNTIPLVQVVS